MQITPSVVAYVSRQEIQIVLEKFKYANYRYQTNENIREKTQFSKKESGWF